MWSLGLTLLSLKWSSNASMTIIAWLSEESLFSVIKVAWLNGWRNEWVFPSNSQSSTSRLFAPKWDEFLANQFTIFGLLAMAVSMTLNQLFHLVSLSIPKHTPTSCLKLECSIAELRRVAAILSYRRGVTPLQPAARLLLVVAVVVVPAEARVLPGCLLPLPLPRLRPCYPSSSTWLGAEPSVFVWSSLNKTVSPFCDTTFPEASPAAWSASFEFVNRNARRAIFRICPMHRMRCAAASYII